MEINLAAAPYDSKTIANVSSVTGCEGVRDHFHAHAIRRDDSVTVEGAYCRILAVVVTCGDTPVYDDGDSSGPPSHIHGYADPDVKIRLWLERST